jgi:hypothetical protein
MTVTESYYGKKQREAAEKLAVLLRRRSAKDPDDFGIPMRPDGTFHEEDDAFEPWPMFGLFGCYSSDFDEMAIDVLQNILEMADAMDGPKDAWCAIFDRKRTDLAAEMFREMLCFIDLCDYGTSPRGCFPTMEFRPLLPEFIAKWRDYSKARWG